MPEQSISAKMSRACGNYKDTSNLNGRRCSETTKTKASVWYVCCRRLAVCVFTEGGVRRTEEDWKGVRSLELRKSESPGQSCGVDVN